MCVIPCKSSSQRIPQKNTRLLASKSLLQRTLDVAQQCDFETIWVSSESHSLLKRLPASVQGHLRPQHLADNTSTVFDVCKDLLSVYSPTKRRYDYSPLPESFAVLLPTSPLRKVSDIENAIDLFENTECVMSVTPCIAPEHTLTVCDRNRLHAGPFIDRKRQELQPSYVHDGTIIICKTEAFLQVDDFYDLDTIPLVIEDSLDVNSPFDWRIAEAILEEK